jgi:hypothetical protein
VEFDYTVDDVVREAERKLRATLTASCRGKSQPAELLPAPLKIIALERHMLVAARTSEHTQHGSTSVCI